MKCTRGALNEYIAGSLDVERRLLSSLVEWRSESNIYALNIAYPQRERERWQLNVSCTSLSTDAVDLYIGFHHWCSEWLLPYCSDALWPCNVTWYYFSKHMHIRSIYFMDFCNVQLSFSAEGSWTKDLMDGKMKTALHVKSCSVTRAEEKEWMTFKLVHISKLTISNFRKIIKIHNF